MAFIEYDDIVVLGYMFPGWARMIGWLLTFSSIICIPAYMIYRFIATTGGLKQV